MEKNTNMPNADDELCLKYVLNELDPSEIMLVERAMAEDDDTLIEVESMRATLRRLNRLPEYIPPASVQQQILEQAKEHAEGRYSASKMINLFSLPASTTYTAAALAAVLIITLSYGVYQYSADFQQNSTEIPDAASNTFAPASVSQTAPATDFSYRQTGNNSSGEGLQPLPANNVADVKPWIDENRILHLSIRGGQQSRSFTGNVAGFQNAGTFGVNIRPLIPLNGSTGRNDYMMPGNATYLRDIQLTKTAGTR